MKFGLQIYSFTWPGGPEVVAIALAVANAEGGRSGPLHARLSHTGTWR